MSILTCVLIVPGLDAPDPFGQCATPDEAYGPYPLLPQAEYAARILTRLKGAAEIVPAGRNGPWWVRNRLAD